MNAAFAAFLALAEQDRRDAIESAAGRLDTLPTYVEKDLWVCVVLDAIFNGLPDGHPRLLFKGGTSLSKVFGLIDRFSEDIDLVVYRDRERLPEDRNRISRHYYDAAMITATETGASALSDLDLLDAVRSHNLMAFRQAWKRFEQATPGSVRLVPQPGLREAIERDYAAMQSMILGDAPDFEWINEQLQQAENAINHSSQPSR